MLFLSAKMNRAILHNCPVHSYEDLIDTARAIVESSTENKALQDMLVRSLRNIFCFSHIRVNDLFPWWESFLFIRELLQPKMY